MIHIYIYLFINHFIFVEIVYKFVKIAYTSRHVKASNLFCLLRLSITGFAMKFRYYIDF